MMAKGHRRRRREASLTEPSTVAGSTGRGRLTKLQPLLLGTNRSARRLPYRRSPSPPEAARQFRYVTKLTKGEPAMPRGRQPEGTRALTNAERQARYRARRQAANPPPSAHRHRQPIDRRSLADKWRAAVAALLALQAKYADWLDALPETLLETQTAEALQAIVDLDLDELAATEPPRGFGRD